MDVLPVDYVDYVTLIPVDCVTYARCVCVSLRCVRLPGLRLLLRYVLLRAVRYCVAFAHFDSRSARCGLPAFCRVLVITRCSRLRLLRCRLPCHAFTRFTRDLDFALRCVDFYRLRFTFYVCHARVVLRLRFAYVLPFTHVVGWFFDYAHVALPHPLLIVTLIHPVILRVTFHALRLRWCVVPLRFDSLIDSGYCPLLPVDCQLRCLLVTFYFALRWTLFVVVLIVDFAVITARFAFTHTR